MPIQLVGAEGIPRGGLVEVEVVALPLSVYNASREILFKSWSQGIDCSSADQESALDGVYDWPLFGG